MCLIVLETKGLSFQSTAFHSLVWNTVSYCSQGKQAAICKNNLFTDFWVTWLFPGSSSPCFLWEKSQTKPFFYVDVVWKSSSNMLLPGQQLRSSFSTHLRQDAEGIHISWTWWEVFTMQRSCLILPKSHFWKQTQEPSPSRSTSAPWPLWPNGCQKSATAIAALNSHSFWLPDIVFWQNLLGGATELLNLLPDPQLGDFCDCYHLHLFFEKKRQKPAALEGLYPPGAFMLVQVSRKAITTWSCDLWIHLKSFKSLSCSWEHYWILLCRH